MQEQSFITYPPETVDKVLEILREEIVQALLSLSRLVQEHPEIVEVDINPLMLYSDGRPATAVDAMVVWKQE